VEDERAEWQLQRERMELGSQKWDEEGTRLADHVSKLRAEAAASVDMISTLEMELSRVRREFAQDRAEWSKEKSKLLDESAESETSRLEALGDANRKVARLESQVSDLRGLLTQEQDAVEQTRV